MRVRCRGADGPPPAARRRRRYRPSSQAEHLLHRIAPGGLVGEPQCGADGAAREDVAVFGAVAKLDPLALPGEDDLVIAGDRSAAQRREADRAFAALADEPAPPDHADLGQRLATSEQHTPER